MLPSQKLAVLWRCSMKVRWTIVAISCLTLICAGVIIWRLVHAQINNRQLAKEAAAYRIRAEQGDAGAQYILGYLYYYGYGVPQDKGEANRLFYQAAAQGNEDAKRAVGWKTVRLPATSKFMLPLKIIGSLVFGIAFLKSSLSYRTREQIVTGVAALLLICAVALDLFWHFYVGHLQSSTTVTTLYLLRQLVGGSIVGVLAFIVHRKSAKVVLIAAAAIFVGFIAFEIVH